MTLIEQDAHIKWLLSLLVEAMPADSQERATALTWLVSQEVDAFAYAMWKHGLDSGAHIGETAARFQVSQERTAIAEEKLLRELEAYTPARLD